MKIQPKYKMKKAYSRLWNISLLVIIGTFAFSSCESFVEINPPDNQLINETVYITDGSADAALRGVYRELITGFAGGNLSITHLGGLSADELDEFTENADYLGFYVNKLSPENGSVNSIWENVYNVIYQTNAILEGLSNSKEIGTEVREQLEGEAKCLRAFCYFYLINLWGDVPLITSTHFEENRLIPRTPILNVYEFVIQDLKEAQGLLAEGYAHAAGERVRVNKGVATALLARVYLYMEDWGNAEVQSTAVIENPLYILKVDLNTVFLKNDTEAIWQLKPLFRGNTNEAEIFILTGRPDFTALSDFVYNAFEAGDERKSNWTGTFTNETGAWNFPYKYKIKSDPDPDNATEYSMVLRLAEQYLIRAEARAQQGNLTGAQEDLNMIRNRAGLENTTAVTKVGLLDAILQERQVELFTEWGHRWLDLKRTGRADAILSSIKPGWQSTSILWPIPQQEIDNNPNLKQNEGY